MFHVKPVKRTKSESAFIRMTPEDRELLERMARDSERTMTQIIEFAIDMLARDWGYRTKRR